MSTSIRRMGRRLTGAGQPTVKDLEVVAVKCEKFGAHLGSADFLLSNMLSDTCFEIWRGCRPAASDRATRMPDVMHRVEDICEVFARQDNAIFVEDGRNGKHRLT